MEHENQLHKIKKRAGRADGRKIALQLKEKWKRDAETKGYFFIVFMMTCVTCNQSKERTTEFFQPIRGYTHIFNSKCGEERFYNSPSYPCIDCHSKLGKERRQTKKFFIQTCIESAKANHHKYISRNKIHNDTFDINLDSIESILNERDGRCMKTGVPINFGCYKDFAMSIDRINNSIGYTINNIQLVCRETNVQGSEKTCGQTTKHDYIRVFMSLINFICHMTLTPTNQQDFEINLKQSPKENGVTASITMDKKLYQRQCDDLHIKSILKTMSSHANQHDVVAKRTGPLFTIEMALDVLRNHNFRCYYSKLPLEISISSRFRFSFERLDNSKTHGEPNNVVPVVRFLNCSDRSSRKNNTGTLEDNGAGMSMTKLLRMILQTDLVELTSEQRQCIEKEINKTSIT